jgi:death on curing protein
MNDYLGKHPTFRHRRVDSPTVNAVMRLHDRILEESEGLPGVRDKGLLESALHKIVDGFDGQDSYPTFFTKLAAVGYSIAQNHVFTDANKRTALETMLLALRLNGYRQRPSTDAATTVMVLVATGNLEIAGLRVALIHWCGLNPGDSSL